MREKIFYYLYLGFFFLCIVTLIAAILFVGVNYLAPQFFGYADSIEVLKPQTAYLLAIPLPLGVLIKGRVKK